jgi:hypothetical protein
MSWPILPHASCHALLAVSQRSNIRACRTKRTSKPAALVQSTVVKCGVFTSAFSRVFLRADCVTQRPEPRGVGIVAEACKHDRTYIIGPEEALISYTAFRVPALFTYSLRQHTSSSTQQCWAKPLTNPPDVNYASTAMTSN